jgi:hypothetical protein
MGHRLEMLSRIFRGNGSEPLAQLAKSLFRERRQQRALILEVATLDILGGIRD